MKTFSEFLTEELDNKETRIFKWLKENADAIKDWMAGLFDCEVYFSVEFGGMIIIPDADIIEMTNAHKEEFADMFGREFVSIFPFKYSSEIKGEKVIISSPFEEGSEIPELPSED